MLFNFKNEDGEIKLEHLDKSLDLKTLSLGTPHKGSSCSFRITDLNKFSTEHETSHNIVLAPSTYLSWNNSESDQKNAIVGVTSTSDFDRLFDICLTRLHVGETGKFVVKCYRSGFSYSFKLQLVKIQESVELYDLSTERIEEMCNSLKDSGKYLFTEGYTLDAFYKFSEAMKICCIPHPRTRKSSQLDFISTLQGNMASCHVKFENWNDAIDLCNSVLEHDPNNVKALYRRGLSQIEIQEYEKARDDLQRAKQLEPENTAVKSKLAQIDKREKKLDAKYAQAMKKYFA